jgi:sec-independent protein translocase protein TatA
MSLTLTPLIFNLGPTELIIILVIVLLLFGGSRLAGLGKSSGRALKEFKEETKGLREDKDKDVVADPAQPVVPPTPQVTNGQNGYAAPTTPPEYKPYPQTPNNLADPSAPEVRRDV